MLRRPQNVNLPHPLNWKCDFQNGTLLLNTGYYTPHTSFDKPDDVWFTKILNLSGEEITIESDAPPSVEKTHSDSKTHTFGEYVVSMASPMQLECHRASELAWKLRLTAYLYTNVEERGGVLYFGTAGRGGHFYGVRLADGTIFVM
jgi:hypothetical protein